MKRFAVLVLLTALLAGAGASRTYAQATAEPASEPVYHNAASFYANNPAWWRALSKQLVQAVDVPPGQVSEPALQNVIYFATHYGDKVQLGDATAPLYAVYRYHDQVAYRLMALAALHALGDEPTMQRLYVDARTDTSARVQRMAVAVVNDFYRQK